MTPDRTTLATPVAEVSSKASDHALMQKVTWRLLPILSLAFVVNYLDRVNVGFAGLTMRTDLGLTATQFGNAAGLLFLSYCFLELPSNIALYRFGARIWLARIMITWGILSAATALVTGPHSFYLVRILLGAAEAGFFPGVAYFIHCWFPPQHRARALALFTVAVPLSSVIGGPVSSWFLKLDGVAGLHGWAWLFIGEALPAVIIGLLLPLLIADRPANAKWLSANERTRLESMIPPIPERHRAALLPALKDQRVLLLSLVNFSYTLGSFGVSIWLPTIIKAHHLSTTATGYVTAIPYIFACIGVLACGVTIDKGRNRVALLALSCGGAAAGLVFSMIFSGLVPALIGMTVAVTGVNVARCVFWTIPGTFLSGKAAAGGFALINTIGILGGYFGPLLVGWLKDVTGAFGAGVLAMAALLALAVVLVAVLSKALKGSLAEGRGIA